MTPDTAPGCGPAGGAHGQGWAGWLCLGLAVAGMVLPWLAHLDFIRERGSAFDLGLFLQMATANSAARSLSGDLAIGATAVSARV